MEVDNMGERLTTEPVVDRNKHPKKFLYIDKEGYPCVADRGGGKKLSPEERTKKEKERKEKRERRKEEGRRLRSNITNATKNYNGVVKSKNLRMIKNALESIDVAKKAYEKFKQSK